MTDELQDYVELQTAQNLARGLAPATARAEALRSVGGLEQVKESCRDARGTAWFENTLQDVHFGCRILAKNPGFTLLALITLALGIGATTAIFSVVKAVLLAPLPYKEPNRIVVVSTRNKARGDQPASNSAGDFAIWRQRCDAFEDIAPSYDNEQTLTGEGPPQLLLGYAVSASYFRILGVQPRLGRLYTDAEDRPGGPKVAVISDQLWRTTFHSDRQIIGRNIRLDGNLYSVTGVMPPAFNYPTGVQVWTPTALAPTAADDFVHRYVRVLGRLKSGITAEDAQRSLARLETQISAAHPDTDSGNRPVVISLRQHLDGDIRKPLLILLAAVGLVLLIACANTAGLTLARNVERQKEIGVRLALGATRVRLLRQFAAESLLLAVIGGAAGLLLAFAGTTPLLMLFPNDVANLDIPKVTQIPIDRGVLLFTGSVTMLTALLFGIAPIARTLGDANRSSLNESSRGNTAARWSSRARSGIVIAEMALSLMLLTAAGLVLASFQKVTEAKLGFQPDHVLSLEIFLPPDRYQTDNGNKIRALVRDVALKMRSIPGVKSAAATNFLPLTGFWGTTEFLLRGQHLAKGEHAPEADHRVMTPDYLPTMLIPLLRGRDFNDSDRAGSAHVAIINETLARRFFKGVDPVGQEINLGSVEKPDWWRIAGVAGDVKAFGQDQPTHPDIYRPFDQVPFPLVAFALRTATDPMAMEKSAKQALWSVDPELAVFKSISVNVLAQQSLAVRRASSVLIASFAGLALVLACVGIYGVMAYAVVRRKGEIGLRMALGAQPGDVLALILKFGLRLTCAGFLIGLAGALACSRLLESLLFQVGALDPLIFTSASALLIALALVASFIPARRATRVDAMQTLRAE